MQTITYKKVNDCGLKADFYPVTADNAPLIVYIHGGGLIWGSRKDIREEQVTLYNEAGYNVLSIDYRLAPETKLPEIADDVKDLFHWLEKEGTEELNFDPERIAVIGSSAGGYLALLSGTLPNRPKAVISFYGYGNILGEWYTKPSPHFAKMTQVPAMLVNNLIQKKPLSVGPIERRYAIYLYCRQQGKWNEYVSGMDPMFNRSKLEALCPIRHVGSEYPPTMLLHGDQDEDVPYKESADMAEALNQANVPHQFITIPGGKHVFDEHMQEPAVKDAFSQVLAFLNEYV